MRKTTFAIAVALSVLVLACSKNYDIVLPPAEPQLTVECYLEDGLPIRALISESTDLLDTATVPRVLIPARVVITHRGQQETLLPLPFVDLVRRRVYNYSGTQPVQANYTSGDEYRIDVWDNQGRHAYGNTRFIKPVAIASLQPTFNNAGEAYCLTTFPDDPASKNFYRLVLNKNARYDSVAMEQLLDDNFANTAGNVVYGSGYDFRRGDSVHATLFHLTPEYHQYLTTLQNARTALVNPFAVSGEVVSNIKGGLGVFAALSYTRKSVKVQ